MLVPHCRLKFSPGNKPADELVQPQRKRINAMNLREQLQAIDIIKMQNVCRIVMPEHFVSPQEASHQEIVLQNEF
jgi:hypothetical protein